MQNIQELSAATGEPAALAAAPTEPATLAAAPDEGQQPSRRRRLRLTAEEWKAQWGLEQAHAAQNQAKDIIGTTELCERLGKSRGTIESWRRSGWLPCMVFGRSVMFSWSSVLEAMKRRERRAE
jgi:hypothetical protein